MTEDRNKLEQENKRRNSYTGLGIPLGAAFGFIVGLLLFDNLALGFGIGFAMGLVFDSAMDTQKKKSG